MDPRTFTEIANLFTTGAVVTQAQWRDGDTKLGVWPSVAYYATQALTDSAAAKTAATTAVNGAPRVNLRITKSAGAWTIGTADNGYGVSSIDAEFRGNADGTANVAGGYRVIKVNFASAYSNVCYLHQVMALTSTGTDAAPTINKQTGYFTIAIGGGFGGAGTALVNGYKIALVCF